MTQSNSLAGQKPVWFITGCSTGFELARTLLERGYRTVVTARSLDALAEFAGHANALLLELDVCDARQVGAAVEATPNSDSGASTCWSITPGSATSRQSRRARTTPYAICSTSTCSRSGA